MKSLADLEAIRARTLESINMRKDEDAARVVIGMATCGIAAGARPVMLAFMEEIQKRNLQHVTVSQTGCIGMCRYEPMLDVILPGQDKVTYIHVKPEMVPRIVTEHIVNGNPVVEYTIGAAKDSLNDKEEEHPDGALSFSCAGLRRYRLFFFRFREAD